MMLAYGVTYNNSVPYAENARRTGGKGIRWPSTSTKRRLRRSAKKTARQRISLRMWAQAWEYVTSL